MSFKNILKKQEKELEKKHEERKERCIPVAREMLGILSKHAMGVPMGDVEPIDEGYTVVAQEMLELLLKHNVRWSDREFVFQLMMQGIEFPKTLALESLGRSWKVLLTGLLGKSHDDLTMTEVDALLKKGDTVLNEEQK